MSEPNSLYVKIEIKKERLQEFLDGKPKEVVLDDDWTAWWDLHDMVSKPPLTDIQPYRLDTNRTLIDEFLKDTRMGAAQHYDDAPGTWYLIILMFSENYLEILPMLAWLKDLAQYQEKHQRGTALIYDFLWGDGSVMAQLDFSAQQANLTNATRISDIDAEILNEANSALDTMLNDLQKRYNH